tara:strand:+ start:378 stop:548 length:171 start_codon:yes stop_codon:yes gene_type:complete
MFLWRALKPQAVLAAFAVLSKTPSARPEDAPVADDRRTVDVPALRFSNPYDPNSLT